MALVEARNCIESSSILSLIPLQRVDCDLLHPPDGQPLVVRALQQSQQIFAEDIKDQTHVLAWNLDDIFASVFL